MLICSSKLQYFCIKTPQQLIIIIYNSVESFLLHYPLATSNEQRRNKLLRYFFGLLDLLNKKYKIKEFASPEDSKIVISAFLFLARSICKIYILIIRLETFSFILRIRYFLPLFLLSLFLLYLFFSFCIIFFLIDHFWWVVANLSKNYFVLYFFTFNNKTFLQ